MSSSENISVLEQPIEGFIAEFFDWEDYRGFYFSQKNKDKSGNNEDAVFLKTLGDHAVIGVCDGVGGHPMGKEAAQLAAEVVIGALSEDDSEEGMRYLGVLEAANNKVRDLKVGARTTLALGALSGHQAQFFSVGDSEILYTNNRGSVIYTNIPHSPVGYAVEAGLMSESESMDDPDRNIVSNLLGDETLRFEVSSQIEIKKGHSILIATDGVFDNIEKSEVCRLISTGGFDDAAKALQQLCVNFKENGDWRKDDDISFVLLRRIRSSAD